MFINICFLIQDKYLFFKIWDLLISFDFYFFFSQFTNVEVNNFLHNHVHIDISHSIRHFGTFLLCGTYVWVKSKNQVKVFMMIIQYVFIVSVNSKNSRVSSCIWSLWLQIITINKNRIILFCIFLFR